MHELEAYFINDEQAGGHYSTLKRLLKIRCYVSHFFHYGVLIFQE